MEEGELQEKISVVTEILVDPDLAFNETRDQYRIRIVFITLPQLN